MNFPKKQLKYPIHFHQYVGATLVLTGETVRLEAGEVVEVIMPRENPQQTCLVRSPDVGFAWVLPMELEEVKTN